MCLIMPPKLFMMFFHEGWIQWAGPPSLMTVDMEGGFRSREFWEDVSNHGTTVISIAGTAHWQAGKVERHNQIIKEILRNVIKHVGAKGSEHVRKVAAEAVRAKNSLGSGTWVVSSCFGFWKGATASLGNCMRMETQLRIILMLEPKGQMWLIGCDIGISLKWNT